jgi:hypothetical protein
MSPFWIAVITGLVLLATGVAAWLYTRSPALSLNDRYAAEPLLVREQVVMLNYLIKTFPGQVVVPQVLLRNILSVRRAASPQLAKERLGDQKVDFVVCSEDGRPLFAFDMAQHHLSDAAAKAHQAKVKNRMLKTAGVRLVQLESSINRMPTPDDFREQLNMAALPRPQFNRRATDRVPLSPRQKLESHFSEFDTFHASSSFKESEVLDMNGLAELDEMLGRPGSRRMRKDHSGPDSLQSSHSCFDDGTVDVRGG